MKKALYFLFSFAILTSVTIEKANAEENNNSVSDNANEMNDYHNIEEGDMLWEIASRHHESIDGVSTREELLKEGIKPGQQEKEESKEESKENDNVVKKVNVKATAYTAYCDGCIGITKTGVDLRENPEAKVIAVDPSVIPLGSKVYVEGFGYARAEDTGSAINGNRIDIFMPSEEVALEWGVQDVTVKILEE
jgi:N-acetylmuramoyl-L-alanine amidase